MSTIVVGYDDKDAARRALDRAIQEAKLAGSRLAVVSVLELPLDPGAPRNFGTLGDGPPGSVPHGVPDVLEPALAHARDRVAAAGVRADFLWAAGDPADVLVEVAREHGASLLVVGAHHHGFFSRLAGTDVPAEVERHAGAPVLVVD
jgi:nucleotide-binding universal stress UspA family protein